MSIRNHSAHIGRGAPNSVTGNSESILQMSAKGDTAILAYQHNYNHCGSA